MKQLHVFYRIFHDDLHPVNELTPSRKREYEDYLYDNAVLVSTPDITDKELWSDSLLQLKYYELLLNNNIKSLKEWLYKQIFVQSDDELHIKKLLKKFQVYIKTHLDKIKKLFLSPEEFENVFTLSGNQTVSDIYKLIYQSLINLFEYLENTFRYYLDEGVVIPCKQRRKFIEENIPKVIYSLNCLKDLDAHFKIKSQIANVLERFLNDGFENFTYARMNYCKSFFSALKRFFHAEEDQTEERLLKLLVQFNFNRNGVLLYLLKKFRAGIEEVHSKSDKLLVLHEYLKSFNQIQTSFASSYNEKVKPLHMQCTQWLEHEIDTLSLQNLSSKEFTSSSEIETTKINTNLSVGDMALLLKLFQQNNTFKMPKSAMFRAISKNFKSKNSERISSKSLSNNYYDITESNKKSVQQLLEQMLVRLENL